MASEVIKEAGNLFNGQGTLFWVAAAAVAAGLTILVVVGFLYLRRQWRGRKQRPPQKADSPVARVQKPATVLGNAQARAYRAAESSAVSAPQTSGYGELLGRLRETADNLEDLRDDLRRIAGDRGDSPLKHQAPAVEYIFKKGVG